MNGNNRKGFESELMCGDEKRNQEGVKGYEKEKFN